MSLPNAVCGHSLQFLLINRFTLHFRCTHLLNCFSAAYWKMPFTFMRLRISCICDAAHMVYGKLQKILWKGEDLVIHRHRLFLCESYRHNPHSANAFITANGQFVWNWFCCWLVIFSELPPNGFIRQNILHFLHVSSLDQNPIWCNHFVRHSCSLFGVPLEICSGLGMPGVFLIWLASLPCPANFWNRGRSLIQGYSSYQYSLLSWLWIL